MPWIRKFCGFGRRQSQTSKGILRCMLAWSGSIAVLVWAWNGSQIDPLQLVSNLGNIGQMVCGFFPPDFHDWAYYFGEMVVTMQMALCATLFAVLCAIPLGLLCAQNIAPMWVYQPVRRLMDAARAINEMVFALLFIARSALVRLLESSPSSFTRRVFWRSSSLRQWNKLIRVRPKEFDRLGLEFWKK
jgi:ABC-type phosphate/phosphonate transport system permease subunit